jgi:hypothetical protein
VVAAKAVKFASYLSAKWQLKIVTVSLLLIIQPTAACEDERQFVRYGGQEWTTLKRLAADHHNRLEEEAPRLLGIGTEPEFAIGQRALLLQSDGGNLLWDCITLLDGQTAAELNARGGICAIAISSALLHDDGGLGGAIRCANIFAHCRSRAG